MENIAFAFAQHEQALTDSQLCKMRSTTIHQMQFCKGFLNRNIKMCGIFNDFVVTRSRFEPTTSRTSTQCRNWAMLRPRAQGPIYNERQCECCCQTLRWEPLLSVIFTSSIDASCPTQFTRLDSMPI